MTVVVEPEYLYFDISMNWTVVVHPLWVWKSWGVRYRSNILVFSPVPQSDSDEQFNTMIPFML
jgi:hypothetical protein